MLNLIIDNREINLISRIKDRDLDCYCEKINIDIKQLDIGDVHIISDTKSLFIERKTVKDLISSVKDGRYKEQKMRLLASGSDITYIIENDDILSSKTYHNQELLSSIYIFSMYRDNIHLIFTKSVEETATFILTLCAKIIDKPDKFSKVKNDVIKDDYVSCIKIKKMGNITPENCFLMQLSQIPTVSVTIAKHIQKQFPNMIEFIKALNDKEDAQSKIDMLCKIEKIGKEKAKKILHFMQFI